MTSNLEEEYFARENAEKLHKLQVERERKEENLIMAKAKQDPRFAGWQWADEWLEKHSGVLAIEMMEAFLSEFKE